MNRIFLLSNEHKPKLILNLLQKRLKNFENGFPMYIYSRQLRKLSTRILREFSLSTFVNSLLQCLSYCVIFIVITIYYLFLFIYLLYVDFILLSWVMSGGGAGLGMNNLNVILLNLLELPFCIHINLVTLFIAFVVWWK